MADIDWEKGAITPPAGSTNATDWDKGEIKPPVEDKGVLGHVRDTAVSLAKGVVAVPEAAVGIGDLVTKGELGRALENSGGDYGFRPKQAREYLDTLKTEKAQQQQQDFQRADGIYEKAKVAVQNPSLVTGAVAESIPVMGAGGVVGRAVTAAAPAISPALAGAIGEGVAGAGSAAEQIRQESKDGRLTTDQALLAAGSGAATTAFGAMGNKIAGRLGVGDAETMLVTGLKGAAPAVQQTAVKSIPRQVIEGAISEGLLEELPQSVSEQVLQNLALGKPWHEEVDSSIVLGVLSGGAMGGGAAGIHGLTSRQPSADSGLPPSDPVQPAQQTAQHANPGLERVRLALADQLQALQQQEQGEPAVPQTQAPDGAAILAKRIADEQAARDSMLAAQRAVGSPDDEIFQSTGMSESRAMGIDPAAGTLSAAAAIAVDTGAHAQTLTDAVQQVAGEVAQKDAKQQASEGASPVQAPVTQDRVSELQSRLDFIQQQGRSTGWNKGMVAQRDQIRDELAQLQQQNTAEASAPKSLKEGIKKAQQKAKQTPEAQPIEQAAAVAPQAEAVPAAAPSVAQPAADIKSVIAKQIPQMNDAELQQAITHYGPDHKRTAKLQKELAKRSTASPQLTGATNGTQAVEAVQAGTQPAQAGAAPVSAVAQPSAEGVADAAQSPNAGAPASTPGSAQEQKSTEPVAQAGEAWTRMPAAERQAIASRAGLKPIVAKNAHKAAWADLNGDIQKRLASAMQPAEQARTDGHGNTFEAGGEINLDRSKPAGEFKPDDPIRVRGGDGKVETIESVGADGWIYTRAGSAFPPEKAGLLYHTTGHMNQGIAGEDARRAEEHAKDAKASEASPVTVRKAGAGATAIVIDPSGGPHSRTNGTAEREAAKRLEQLRESLPAVLKPRAQSARQHIKSVIEELNKERTSTSIISMLETASDRFFKDGHEPASRVVDEVIDSLSGKQSGTQTQSKSEAPEHAAVGVDDRELAEVAAEFSGAMRAEASEGIHHLFDAPTKGEVVRLADKAKVYHKDHGWMTPAEARQKIEEWKARAAAQGDDQKMRSANSQKIVLSLFDLTGKWSQPWEEAGYQVFRFDIQDDPELGDVNKFSVEHFQDWFSDFDGQDIYAILAACPCTDFASSGARHFAAKDADGRTVASVKLVHQTLRTIEYFKPSVWAVENPVGRIESLGGLPPWRLAFDPNHLGDPYTKKTLIWGRFNGDLPIAPVEPTEGSKMHKLYGGKSIATKNARSATPEGFAYGFFMANNAIDNPEMALANKYDRLDRALIGEAVAAGLTEDDINQAVEDAYYMDLDDQAAEEALREAIAERADESESNNGQEAKPAQSKAFSEPVAETSAPDQVSLAPDRFAGNKLFTADKVAAARERMKRKLGTLNSGIDPELLVDGMTVAGAYIESGVRNFSQYAKLMIEDMGEGVKPYLLSFWEGARNFPGLNAKDMTSAEESARQHEALMTPAATEQAKEAIGTVDTKPKGRTKKTGAKGDMVLTQDWGTEHINGYGDSERENGNDTKDAFLKETRNYLNAVADALRAYGFEPHLDRKGKEEKPVSVNESGMAGSGDVTLTMRNAENGNNVYIHIGDTALRGVVPATPSGIAIMYRVSAGEDRYAAKGGNTWAPVDLSANDLATLVSSRVQPAKNKEASNARTLPTDQLPGTAEVRAGEAAAAGDGDRKPLDDGLAQEGAGADLVGRVPAGAEVAGGSGTRGVQQSGEQAPGAARDRGPVRTEQRAADPVADPATAETSPKPELDQPADFQIDAEDIGKGGLTKKYRENIAAIRILKAMAAEGRKATPEERRQIARYVGWGALKGVFDKDNKQWSKEFAELRELLTDAEYKAARASTLNAHYTSPTVVGGINQALDRLGFTRGRVIEPSVGTGNFFGLMPAAMRKGSQLHGVELDPLTSQIAAALYPSAKIAQATGFQDYQIPAEYFDLAIGNPPFGSEPIVDDDRSPYSGFSIHNYFFAKSIDKLRPGGLLAMVVSHSFLDAKNDAARKWIAERANLVSAVRLPRTAFKENAGTDVVTDIVVFQKKSESERTNGLGDDAWVKVGQQTLADAKTGEDTQHTVSQYFLSNTENVLGTPTAAGSMYRAGEYTVEPSGDLAQQLKAWAERLPQGIYQAIERTHEKEAADVVVPDGIKVGSFFVDAKGAVQMRGPDAMGSRTATSWAAPNSKAAERMRGMIGLRDALRTQMRLERSPDSTEEQVEDSRRQLNEKYDAFQKSNGYLNDPTNRRIFLDDTESALLLALEFDYDKGVSKAVAEKEGIEARPPKAVKADILSRRVMFPPADNIKVSSAKDALLASLNYKGKLDLDYMAGLYDKPADEIVKELGDVVFTDPLRGLVMSDEYLSGDVKTKLAEAEAAALDSPAMRRNVEALKKVIPVDKRPSEIHAALGANFIPADLFQQFAKEITGADARVSYVRATGQWLVEFTGTANPALDAGKWGIGKMTATAIFARSMAGQGVIVTQTVKNGDGSTTTVVLEKETEAAREKQSAMKAEWQRWLWSDPDRADRVAGIYNEKMNRIVVRKFDGSHMTFPGMSPAMELLPHQKNAVWRGLQSPQTLLDHVVGAGKTFEIVALFMEMRRLGIARKPFIAVPNHLTLQWRSEFSRLYPAANVLAATPDDFAKGGREKFFSKIITGDWDAVIVGHSSLKKIALPPETEKAVLEEQIEELATAIEETKRGRGDRNIIRDMEGIKRRLEAKMKERIQALGERDKVVTFDELGVDAFAIDELHEFKNLFYNSTMERVPGMGNPGGSDKAFDLFVKVQHLFNTFGDKAPIIGATGTPVSNSLVEMFNMQRFLQYPTLKAEGLHVFDAWAKQFGSVESLYEVSPSGTGYRQSSRFAKFKNLPALMSHYQTFADTITLDDLKAQELARGKSFPVPKLTSGRPINVVAKRSPRVADFMGVPQLDIQKDVAQFGFNPGAGETVNVTKAEDGNSWRVERSVPAEGGKELNYSLGTAKTEEDARLMVVEAALSPQIKVDPKSILGQFQNLKQITKETKGKVNALSLTGQANKAGLDYRLIDPSAPDFEGSKINLSIGNMMELYQSWSDDKGVQLVFCDLSVPLSSRSGFSAKERRVYVRENGELAHKRGTLHTVAGHEDLPFFVVKEGGKDAKAFTIYDAATGLRVHSGLPAKGIATDWAAQTMSDPAKLQRWIDARDQLGDIEQDAIDDYNNANEIDTEETESISLADIAGISGDAKFSVYDDIKTKLIARGVPDREIAFIHDYSTPAAKDKLFKAVNSGQVRFLLGSTPKMGAGTNVQQLLVGLHHIDAPWRPSDLEQREGRIIRRGNRLYERDPGGFEVGIYRYATEQTYDTRRWQILEHKARGIEQLRNYDGTLNEIDDIEGEAANSADMKAAASGDPLILEETQLRNDVRRLESLQASHADETSSLVRRARDQERFAEEWGPKELADFERLKKTSDAFPVKKDEFAGLNVNGKKFTDREDAVKAIKKAMDKVFTESGSATMMYRGVEFTFEGSGDYAELNSPTGNLDRFRPLTEALPSAAGFLTRFANYINRLPGHIADLKAKMEEAKNSAKQMREEASKPFLQADDLTSAREAHKRVQRRLVAKGPDIPAKQKPLLEAGMKKQRQALRDMGYGDALDEFMGGQDGEVLGSRRHHSRGVSTSDQAIYGMTAEGKSADEILSFIKSASRDPLNRQIARLLQKTGLKTTVQLGDRKGMKFKAGEGHDYAAAYDPKADRAYLLRPAGAERNMLHELVHAATVKALAKPGLAATRMKALHQHVRKTAHLRGMYGMTSVEEFVSEAFTNPEFQRALKHVSAPAGSTLRSAWDSLVRIIKGILGLPPNVSDNALSVALDLGVAVMRENMALAASNDTSGKVFGNVSDARAYSRKAVDLLNQNFNAPGKLSWWHKTVGTMHNLAERSPQFKRVFTAAQGFIDDVSHYANDAADMAPTLLPKLDTWRDIWKSPISAEDNKALAKPIFEGTLIWSRDLGGKPVRIEQLEAEAAEMQVDEKARRLLGTDNLTDGVFRMWQGLPQDQFQKLIDSRYESAFLQAGIVWSDSELRSMFGLNDQQIGLYREFRASTDRSLDTMARADMLRYGGEDAKPMRDAVMSAPDVAAAAVMLRDYFAELADAEPDRAEQLLVTANGMMDRADKVSDLQARGYAPLSRFGQYTVDVVVDGEREFFGLFETAREANAMAARMRKEFGEGSVSQGTISQEAFKLFAGVTPETLELFGNHLGLNSTGDQARDQVFQEFLKLTKSNRSAMKRLIHRQGIAGYSEDVGRVLASFVYSNARQTAAGLNIGDLGEAVDDIQKEQGELKDAAFRLADYVKNPQEEAQAIRGLLFAQYLGGSIASAFVNMTQPVAVSFPWLSQFGGAKKAASELAKAAKQIATRGHTYEKDLADALKLAEEDGTVSPQEVHQLMAQAQGRGALRAGDGTKQGDALALASNGLKRLAFAWGKVFGAAEQVNRRVTYIAAFRMAKQQGMPDPAEFAKRAVVETQFQYSKANKMQWGRGAIGGTLMTFKTYSIAYLELLHRMYTQGGPEGKKAALLALGVLMLMGGAGGLPFAEDAEDAADALAQMLGYNFSVKQARQQFLEDVFGRDIGNFIEKGVTGLPGAPIDVSGRIGMGNLIPGTGMLQSKTSHTSDLLEIAGPVGDFAKRIGEGAGKLIKGDVGGALLQVSPVAVRNAAKGADMAATGMYRDQKGYKVLDTNVLEAAAKAIGFQPQSVATIQEANASAQQSKNFYNLTAQEIRAKWAQGIFEGDSAKVEEARADIADWNRKNPDQRMVISIPSVMSRVKEMRKSKDQRIAESAPRAMRAKLREEFSAAKGGL